MKITKITTYRLPPRWMFLKIETDEGVVGWGEPVIEGRARTVEAAVHELGDYLIGQDPSRINDLWQVMYRAGFYRGGPILMSAIAGIDQALWDIKGKVLNAPVWQLMGGLVRDKIKAYSWVGGDRPADVIDGIKTLREIGFDTFKLNGCEELGLIDNSRAVDAAVNTVAQIREAFGNQIEFGLDFHGRVSAPMAKVLIKELEPYRPLFIEEPVLAEQAEYYPKLAAQTHIPLAAGLAVGGLHPVVAIYSSFLQRAYDQILHDVCLQNVPVIFAIDRAGLVGSDGETHQGIFDLSFLSSIPNMHIMAPKNKWELSDMMKFAYDFKGPIAIRYPRGEAYDGLADKRADVEMGKSEMLFEEEKIALFAVGSMVKTAVEVREALKEKGIPCTVVNARFVKPIDENMVRYLAKNHDLIVPMEENVASGGLSEKVITLVEQEKLPIEVLPITIPDEYVEHGNVDILKQEIGISTSAVLEKIEKELEAK